MSRTYVKMVACLFTALCLGITLRSVSAAERGPEDRIDGMLDTMENVISHTATRILNFLVTAARIAYSAMILLGLATWLTGIFGGRAGTRFIIGGIALAAVAEFVAL